MKFYKAPFIFITLAYISGLVSGLIFDDLIIPYGIASLVLASVLIYFKKKDAVAFFSCLFIVLGLNSIKSTDVLIDFQQEDKFILTIKEVGNEASEWIKVIAEVDGVKTKSGIESVDARVLIYVHGNSLQEGDQIMIPNDLTRIQNKGNPGEFDAHTYWRSKGIQRIGFISSEDYVLINHIDLHFIEKYIRKIRGYWKDLIKKHLFKDEASVAMAMLVGDKSLMDNELKATFGNAGAAHVLAVSGLHVGIILWMIIWVLTQFHRFLSKKTAFIVAIGIIWIYVAVTGFAPSVTRSAFMFTVLTVGLIYSKKTNQINNLFFSAFVLLILNPNLILDIGFQLSYLAMLGIFLFNTAITGLFDFRYSWLNKIWQGTSVGLSAQLMTFPLTMYYFHQFPNYFFLSNLGVMAFAGVIMVMGILLLIVGQIPVLNLVLGLSMSYAILAMIKFITFINELPYSLAQGFNLNIYQLVIIFSFVLFIYWLLRRKWNAKSLAIVFCSTILMLSWIQMDRYFNTNNNELVVFNHKVPLIAVHTNDFIYCFHSHEFLSNSEKIILESYAKTKGVGIKTIQLNEQKFEINTDNKTVFIQRIGEEIYIDANGKKYTLISGYKRENSNRIEIGAPYLPGKYDHSLRNGAYIEYF